MGAGGPLQVPRVRARDREGRKVWSPACAALLVLRVPLAGGRGQHGQDGADAGGEVFTAGKARGKCEPFPKGASRRGSCSGSLSRAPGD